MLDDDHPTDPDAPLAARLQDRWRVHLDDAQRSAVIAWASFAATFASVRALTHWIRDGHGPSGGGMSVGGRHFHHYNIGIALLAGVGAVGLRGKDQHRHHPATAASYGIANALIVDEAALLIDLQDVYWAKQGRTSVDLAVGIIALGGLGVAGSSLWPAVAGELRPLSQRTS